MRSNYPNLIFQLALTEFKMKYAGSVLGYLWSLVKPMLLFGVLYIIFTYFFNLGKGIPNYPIYLLVGVILWAFFAEATMSSLHSIVNRGDLLRKVDFPKIVIILASTLTALLTFGVNCIVIVLFLLISKIGFSPVNIIFFFVLFEMFLFLLGLSLIMSTLFVKFRDFSHIWEVSLQILFYLTPIIYPISCIPPKLSKLIMLNPLAQIFQDARWSLVDRNVKTSWEILGWPLNTVPLLIVMALLIVGLVYFQKSAKNFAEEI